MKEIGYIYTANNDEYLPVYEGGLITRQKGRDVPEGYCRPSGQWQLMGAIERNNFGHAVRHYTLAQLMEEPIQWTHKNGAQKVFLLDCDHGTVREWTGGHFFALTGRNGPAQYPTANGLARERC